MSEAVFAMIGDTPTVCVDFKNPKAFLALGPTFALEDKLQRRFDWLPVSVSPIARPAARRPNEDRGAQHRRMRAEYYERDWRRYARVYGIDLGDPYRNPDTSVACIGLLFARRAGDGAVRRYLEASFARYWSGRLDLSDVGAIAATLDEAGVAVAGWDAFAVGTGREEYQQISALLRDGGVFDVPAYLVDGDVYFGRQHLPMIEWQLAGRTGEPPL